MASSSDVSLNPKSFNFNCKASRCICMCSTSFASACVLLRSIFLSCSICKLECTAAFNTSLVLSMNSICSSLVTSRMSIFSSTTFCLRSLIYASFARSCCFVAANSASCSSYFSDVVSNSFLNRSISLSKSSIVSSAPLPPFERIFNVRPTVINLTLDDADAG